MRGEVDKGVEYDGGWHVLSKRSWIKKAQAILYKGANRRERKGRAAEIGEKHCSDRDTEKRGRAGEGRLEGKGRVRKYASQKSRVFVRRKKEKIVLRAKLKKGDGRTAMKRVEHDQGRKSRTGRKGGKRQTDHPLGGEGW